MRVRLVATEGLARYLPWLLILSSAFLAACRDDGSRAAIDCSASPGELFERRIEPLFSQDHPNTCGQCHAGGIQLADFVRSDACESIACLEQEGLVDLEHPEQSVLLTFLDRAEPESELITEAVIAEERQAFLDWFQHEAVCDACDLTVCPDPPLARCDLSEDPNRITKQDDPMDCEEETLERLFRGTFYEWRGRCSPCHFREESTATSLAPRFLSRTGTCQVASLNTLRAIERAGYIDIKRPQKSLLLLKPLAEFDGGVRHEGHDKIVKTDEAYEVTLHFLKRYAECQ